MTVTVPACTLPRVHLPRTPVPPALTGVITPGLLPSPPAALQLLYGTLAVARNLSIDVIPESAIAYMTTGYHLPDAELDKRFAAPCADNRCVAVRASTVTVMAAAAVLCMQEGSVAPCSAACSECKATAQPSCCCSPSSCRIYHPIKDCGSLHC